MFSEWTQPTVAIVNIRQYQKKYIVAVKSTEVIITMTTTGSGDTISSNGCYMKYCDILSLHIRMCPSKCHMPLGHLYVHDELIHWSTNWGHTYLQPHLTISNFLYRCSMKYQEQMKSWTAQTRKWVLTQFKSQEYTSIVCGVKIWKQRSYV